jgi:hypothetical protein
VGKMSVSAIMQLAGPSKNVTPTGPQKKSTYFLDIFSLYSNPHEHIGSEALGAEDRSYRGCCLDIQISTRECPDIDDKDVYQGKLTW